MTRFVRALFATLALVSTGAVAATVGPASFPTVTPSWTDLFWIERPVGAAYADKNTTFANVQSYFGLACSGILVGNGARTAASCVSPGVGVPQALGYQVNTANGLVTYNGAFGTPTNLTLTNATGLPLSTGITGIDSGAKAALANGTNAPGGVLLFGGATGRVATLSALQASSTVQFPNGVWRDDYSAGFGAPPLFYQPSGSACSVNAGAGDGGSQVASADGHCWLARSTGGWDWREFGASMAASAAVNRDAAIAATAAAVRTGLSVFLPAGSYSIDTTTTPFSSTSKFSVTSDGQAVLFPTGGGTVFQTTGGGSISNVIVYTTTNPTTGVGILYDGTGGLSLTNVGVAGVFTNFECKSCSGLMANNVTFSGNNSTTGSTLLRIHAKDGSVGSTPGDLFIANAQIRAQNNGGYTHAVVVNALDGLQMVNAHIGFTAADAMLLQPEYTTSNLVGINCASCGIDLNNGGSASGIVMAPLAGFTGHRGANTFVLTQINGAPASGSQCLAINDPAEQGDAFIGFVAGNCGSSGVSITAGSGVKFLGGSLSNNNLANDGSPDMAIANASNVSVRLDMASGAHVPAEHVLVSGTSTNVSVSAENVYSGAVSANVVNTSGTALAASTVQSALSVTGSMAAGLGQNDYLRVSGSGGGFGMIDALGSDTNINVKLVSKGTGSVAAIPGADSTAAFKVLNAASTLTPFSVDTSGLGIVVTGYETVSGTLGVAGATTLSGGTTFYNGLDVVSGFANLRGGVNIGSSLANYLNFSGFTAGGSPYIAASGSDANVSLKLLPKGAGSVMAIPGGDSAAAFKVLNAAGTTTPFAVDTSGLGVVVTGYETVSGTLGVSGATTLASASVTGNETVGGTLGVTGTSTLAALSATSGTFSGTLGVTGAATVGGTFGVTGATTLAAMSATTGAFSGNATVGGTLGVSGATTLVDLTLSGGTTVAGFANLKSGVNIGSSLANYLNFSGFASGGSPYIAASGSDTNISMKLLPKGTGAVMAIPGADSTAAFKVLNAASTATPFAVDTTNGLIAFGTYAAGACTNAGYITVKDSGGTSRKLMVCP